MNGQLDPEDFRSRTRLGLLAVQLEDAEAAEKYATLERRGTSLVFITP